MPPVPKPNDGIERPPVSTISTGVLREVSASSSWPASCSAPDDRRAVRAAAMDEKPRDGGAGRRHAPEDGRRVRRPEVAK